MTNKEGDNIKKVNDIILSFPESVSSEALEKEFILSINDARQSNFIATLIDHCNDDKKDVYIIPDTLYKNIRYIDLHLFINLWKGKEYITDFELEDKYSRYNFKSILKLCDSLSINEELSFVKVLQDKYHENKKS